MERPSTKMLIVYICLWCYDRLRDPLELLLPLPLLQKYTLQLNLIEKQLCPKTLSGHLSRVLFCSHFKSSTVFLPNVIIEYKNWFVQSDKCKRFSCKTISASKIDQTLTDQPKFTNFSMRIVMVFFVCLSVSSLSISFSCRCLVFFNSAFEFFFLIFSNTAQFAIWSNE